MSAEQRWDGHCPAYFSSAGVRHREHAGWRACANHLPQGQTNRWRNSLGRWALALFRRLVGAGRMVARLMGHRCAAGKWNRVISFGSRSAQWKMVRGRNLRLNVATENWELGTDFYQESSSQFSVTALPRI